MASPVLILGGAECVWDDIDALEAMMGVPWPGPVFVANDMGCSAAVCPPAHKGRRWTGRVDGWCTLHAEKMTGWKAQRKAAGLPDGYVTWSSVKRDVIDRNFQGATGGSSGLYDTWAALMGAHYPRAVLCGVAMDGQKNTFSGREWNSYKRYRKGWEREMAVLKPRVRSMSGWTREMFGAPTVEWLGLAFL